VSRLELRCRLTYPSGFRLDLDFATDAPVTAVFGPSGSGKTSVLSLLAGLRRPDAGRIALGPRLLLDTDRGVCLPPEARGFGYVFQDHLLFPHRTVRQNLDYGRRRRGGHSEADRNRVAALLEVDGLLDRLPHTLSGGQRQRVAVGRALLAGTNLLLLDEPLASLDDPLRERLLHAVGGLLAEWRVPALYVSHRPDEVRRLARHVVVLREGRVAAAGTPADVLHS
jgi:molybdate transport system ATP-binding protein